MYKPGIQCMKIHKIGIIMNGVTGRMGRNQHLERSIKAIQVDGGVKINDENLLYPDPILVGRNENKLRDLCRKSNVEKYSTDLDSCLSDSYYKIYFDAQITSMRTESVKKALKAKKDVYCEKPLAENLVSAKELYNLAEEAGVKHGVVQDKLWLPGIVKLNNLIKNGFFGKILSVRCEFGYWVFDGKIKPAQRPSWNYRKEDGGGIILDMFAHWRYIIDNLFGSLKSLTVVGACHIPTRIDEESKEYNCTADDAAYALFELKSGIICSFNSSWAVRVRRDDLLSIQVDGTEGSAVAGLRECRVQKTDNTVKAVWNPDEKISKNYFEDWEVVDKDMDYPNAFRAQWEKFLRCSFDKDPFPWNFLEGAKGVQMAELAYKSWKEKSWVIVPEYI
jgi:predicted dehydrogenase